MAKNEIPYLDTKNKIINKKLNVILNKITIDLGNLDERYKNIGIWCFRYIPGKDALITWAYKLLKDTEETDDDLKKYLFKTEIAKGKGSIGWMLETGKVEIIKDTEADPRASVSNQDKKIKQNSALCYPMKDDKEIYAALDFFTNKPDFWRDKDKDKIKKIVEVYKSDFENLNSLQEQVDFVRILTENVTIDGIGKAKSEKEKIRLLLKRYLKINDYIAHIPVITLQRNNELFETGIYKSVVNTVKNELDFCKYDKNSYLITEKNGNNIEFKGFQHGILKNYFFSFLKEFKRIIYEDKDTLTLSYTDSTNNKLFLKLKFKKANNKDYKWKKDPREQYDFYDKNREKLVAEATAKSLYKSISNPKILEDYPPLVSNSIIENVSKILKDNTHTFTLRSIAKKKEIKIEWDKADINHYYFEEDENFDEEWYLEKLSKSLSNEAEVRKILNFLYIEKNKDENRYKIVLEDDYKIVLYPKYFISDSNFETIKENFTHLFMFVKSEIEKEKALHNATKSAIAAIMSRNMSHNLGSHVLSTVSTGINDPTDMQYLTRYIQQRQDYIAQITTEFPKWTSNYRFIGLIMRNFFEQRLLLKYIAESEGLTAKEYYPDNKDENKVGNNNKNKLHFEINRLVNGEKQEPIPIIPMDITNKERGNYIKHDPLLAIPGGITGVQAFYSILENTIRNAAKHSYKKDIDTNKDNGGLKIIIDYEDKKNYFEFSVYTNVTENVETGYMKIEKYNENINDYFIKKEKDYTIVNNAKEKFQEIYKSENKEYIIVKEYNKEEKYYLKNGNDYETIENDKAEEILNTDIYVKEYLADNLNNKIKTSFINEQNELDYKNWGIAEIKISAGYLIGASTELIGSKGEAILYKDDNTELKKKGIIKAFKTDDKVGYKFRINKPKEVLIICDENTYNENEKNKETLNNNGIYIEKKLPDELDYDFVIIEAKEKNNNLPIRTIEYSNVKDEVANLIKEKKCEEFKISLYKKWIESFNKEFELEIMPYEENHSGANVSLNNITEYLKEKYDKNEIQCDENDFYKINNAQLANKIKGKVKEIFGNKDLKYKGFNEKIESEIKKYYSSKEEVTNKIFKKYNEYIETLPPNYRFSGTDKNNNSKGDSVENYKENLNKLINDTENKGINSDKIYSKFYTENLNTNNSKEHIILHRHMSFGDNTKGSLYAEALSGAQSYFNEIKSLQNNFNGKKLIFNIIETAYFKIHIIDERIAEYYFTSPDIIKKRIEKAGIVVYRTLNNKPIINIDSKENKNININEQNNSENYEFGKNDILIIHQGIIDKFNTHFCIKDKNVELNGLSADKYFVTSGRGKPETHKMPEKAKYIPFSSISTSIIKQYPEKMLLIQTLLKISK